MIFAALGLLSTGCDLEPLGAQDAANPETGAVDEQTTPGSAADDSSTAGDADEPDADEPEADERAAAPAGPYECDGVDVQPGDDLAAVARKQPAGTTFCVRSGVHRVGEVLAQSGDQFLGESGAVLNGARDISAGEVTWHASGGAWYIDGQTQQSEPLTLCHHAEKGCIEGAGSGIHPNQRNEELFVDNRRFQHVAGRGQLGAGTWYFDYAANRIWIGEDPATLGTIETSVHQGAIGSDDASDVVIDNLVVEKYASLPGRGALGGWSPSTRDKTSDFRWRFTNITGRLNHGAAVLMMEGDHLENCKLTRNGQLGFKALGNRNTANDQPFAADFDQRVVVRDCEISRNNQLGYRTGWEAGGFKIGQMPAGSLVENVWSHDNHGPGMWWDGFNRDAVVRSNLIEDNSEEGIFYEISYGDTQIYWNIVRNNGADADNAYSSKGIYLSNAEGTQVYENAVEGSNMAIHIRSTGGREPATRDNKVFRNDLEPTGAAACNGVGVFQGDTSAVAASSGNEFEDNLWRLPDADAAVFCWGDGQRSRLAVDDALGADEDVTTSGQPALPDDATAFDDAQFGAR